MESFERDPRLLRVLVQSAVEPDWSRLPDMYVADSPDERGNPAVRRVDTEYDQISSGMSFSFRLRANPTKRISTNNMEQGEKWRGKRVELRREEDQLAWLERKGEQGGFSVLRADVQPDIVDARTTNLEKVRGRRPAQGDTAPMPLRFGAVLFEGRLEVVDQALFLAALRNGIGSGKAFGFGLLSIASVS
jgi:CRISPR system Cascade subunit CasE